MAPAVCFANAGYDKSQTQPIRSYGDGRIQSGEELFFSLYVKDHYLSEVFAVKSDEGVLLELQSLFSALDFAIVAEESRLRYVGWYIDETQRFELDLKQRRVNVSGQVTTLNTHQVLERNGEVYVEAALLAHWFRLQFNLDYQDLKILLRSEQPLPVEMRIARQSRHFAPSISTQIPVLPWKETPYQAWSPPLIDLQASLVTTNNNEADASISLLGSQDVAFWNANYFISGRSGELISESRLSLTREDVEGVRIGPVEVTQVEVGDVLETRIGGNHRASYSRGFRLSDRPLYKQVDTQTVRISGVIQVGWDVELYHNGIMIDQRLNVQSGVYNFDLVELYFGSNEFELILYGPQGQVLQDNRSYYVAGGSLSKGEGYFDTSIVETGKTLLGNSLNVSEEAGWNLLSRYDYGISDDLSIYSAVRIGLEGQETPYQLSAGLGFDIWNKGIINLDFSRDQKGTQQILLQGRTQFNQHALSAVLTDNITYRDSNELRQQRTQELTLRAAGNILQHNQIRLNYQSTLNWRNDTMNTDFFASNLLSMATPLGTFSHQLDYRRFDGLQGHDVKGVARWQGRVNGTYGRIGLGYQIRPERQLTDYQIQLSRVINHQFDVELDYIKSLVDEGYKLGAGLNWHNDKFRLTGQFNYFQNDDWQIGLTGQISLGYESYSNEFFITDRRLASSGSVLVKVFLDQNNNAILDENDVVLKGVRIKSVQGFAQAFTDENGMALLGNMPLNRQTDILLDEDSLPDPFYISAHDGHSITPRKGFIAYLEYPVVHAGELEGIAFKKEKNGQETPLAYAEIELIDRNNNVISTVKSAYDGYYVFSDIRPGYYEARVKKQSTGHIVQKEKVEVVLSSQGDVLLEVDLVVEATAQLNGFITVGGEFNSLKVLKTYVSILTKKSPQLFPHKPFFVHDKARNKYLLGYHYFEDAQAAANACLKFEQKGIKCYKAPMPKT
ncbi:hypothetical protein S4054249_16730 [Pseudoalteromonas luteoviolacea]|uniref:SpaA-like prealbumin fold domain-containing protein n=2 Tax=Pseudoalteromonas luteoviolacea TaxID=43657 RepID=A0A0F6AAC9_9GAMM|nr:hypothetical protein S4054249_16730 [Pseudoalteromonas luteoviolacea]AOT14305.1 hypothetical protein S40542_16700 [Pseudoalteromonas luteoviolacea]AOT19221.1 hypothetical protein S4054_16705 [Pseudoalteromonas luteoviolacea]KKE83103.1 hypothetical protein N479_15635 [Pseudoalteromonas luteoviolacea S4054]KZN73494.1 hypothetical protein N481_12300 [Pseudoalteromonas luteoviolacea S4047-1]